MDIAALLELSDDDLQEMLGVALLGGGPGMSPADHESYRRFGKEWFGRRYHDLRRRICGNEHLGALRESSSADRVLDALAVQQKLSQFDEYAANSLVLAVLVVRIGVGTFCSGYQCKS